MIGLFVILFPQIIITITVKTITNDRSICYTYYAGKTITNDRSICYSFSSNYNFTKIS